MVQTDREQCSHPIDMYIDEQVLSKIHSGSDYSFSIYEAERTEVILGRSRKKENDVYVQNCTADNIPILRRIGGGGTVLLSKGIIVISIAGKTSFPYRLKEHMNAVNKVIITVLNRLGINNLSIKGISDLALDNKKILGSSLCRKRDVVLYQGSMLLDPNFKLFDQYLKHPDREPDYRDGRAHRQFLTSLRKEGYKINKNIVISALREELGKRIPWLRL